MPPKVRDRSPGGAWVLVDVVAWLDKKRLSVPAPLSSACPSDTAAASRQPCKAADETAEFRWACSLLPDLRERERRALARFVKLRGAAAGTPSAAAKGSSMAASEDEEETNAGEGGPPVIRGGEWPAEVEFCNDYRWGDDVPPPLRLQYQPSASRRRAARPCARTFAAVIGDSAHPACGQCGLFAAKALSHGAWVIDYVGAVTLGENEDRASDYVCDFGDRSELALDAKRMGNEGRFVNDYRNTGRHANVEFRLRRDRCGELRQGIFVAAKEGVRAGEELVRSAREIGELREIREIGEIREIRECVGLEEKR